MRSMLIMAATLAAGFAVPSSTVWAHDGIGYCLYQDQKFSEGAVLNGRVCTRSKATGKAGEWAWAPQEIAELSDMQRELERTRLQTQLVQARSMLVEMEAHYNDATAKLSGKH